MKFAVRSESFCMIGEGLAAELGPMSEWQCSGISTYAKILKRGSGMSGSALISTWPYNALPALVRGSQRVIERTEVTPRPRNQQNVGRPARDGE
jgi:hypothetical protein